MRVLEGSLIPRDASKGVQGCRVEVDLDEQEPNVPVHIRLISPYSGEIVDETFVSVAGFGEWLLSRHDY